MKQYYEVRVYNIFNSIFLNLVFHVILSYELPGIILQIIYMHLQYPLNFWF